MTTRLCWASLSFAALTTTSLGAAIVFINGHFQTRFAEAAEFSIIGLPINSHRNWFNVAKHIPGGQLMFAANGALVGSTFWRETRSAMSGRMSLGQTRDRPESTLLLRKAKKWASFLSSPLHSHSPLPQLMPQLP